MAWVRLGLGRQSLGLVCLAGSAFGSLLRRLAGSSVSGHRPSLLFNLPSSGFVWLSSGQVIVIRCLAFRLSGLSLFVCFNNNFGHWVSSSGHWAINCHWLQSGSLRPPGLGWATGFNWAQSINWSGCPSSVCPLIGLGCHWPGCLRLSFIVIGSAHFIVRPSASLATSLLSPLVVRPTGLSGSILFSSSSITPSSARLFFRFHWVIGSSSVRFSFTGSSTGITNFTGVFRLAFVNVSLGQSLAVIGSNNGLAVRSIIIFTVHCH